jgi:hypothetical protein
LLALLLALVLSGQVWAEDILAKVNGENITKQDLIQYARQSPMLAGYLKTPGGPMRLLNNIITEHLLLLEGKRLAIPRPLDSAGGDFGYVMKIKRELVKPCSLPNEAEIRAFYDKYPELFSTPLLLRMRRIGLKTTEDTLPAIASELEKIKKQIKNNKITFEMAADNLSQDEIGRGRGGDIGFVRINELSHPVYAEFEKADTKEIVGPVEVPGMLYLYQITNRHEPILESYDAVHDEIRQKQHEHCNQQVLETLVSELKKRWFVEVLVDDIGIYPEQD